MPATGSGKRITRQSFVIRRDRQLESHGVEVRDHSLLVIFRTACCDPIHHVAVRLEQD